MLDDFLTNLAVNLAHDLLRAGADRLRTLAFGDAEKRSLHHCYQSGFRAMLDTVFAGLNRDHQALVETILRQFVEPLAGKRHVQVSERRTKVDWAHAMRHRGDGQSEHAQPGFLLRGIRARRGATAPSTLRVPLHAQARQLAEYGRD